MNPDDIFQNLQKGFRVTLGATSALLESIQDPQKREENLTKLRVDPNLLAEELAVKGEVTEREARNFVDSVFQQQQSTQSSSPSSSSYASGPVAPPEVQADLQELTEQIAAMRAELERLRQQNSQ